METTKTVMPEWFRNLTRDSEVFFDMGRYLRHGMEPLAEITELLEDLRPCQHLHLVSSQEPVLLYRIFRPMGFECHAVQRGQAWDIYLKRTA